MKKIMEKIKNTAKAVKAKVCGFAAKVRGEVRKSAAKVRGEICKRVAGVRSRLCMIFARTRVMLASCRGENFVDSGIKILIAVVIGALLLGGLYVLFGDTIMPTVTEKVKDMFNFKG